MKTVAAKKVRILTPKDKEYPQFARRFGATFQHLAVVRSDEKQVELLPITYKILEEDSNLSRVVHVK